MSSSSKLVQSATEANICSSRSSTRLPSDHRTITAAFSSGREASLQWAGGGLFPRASDTCRHTGGPATLTSGDIGVHRAIRLVVQACSRLVGTHSVAASLLKRLLSAVKDDLRRPLVALVEFAQLVADMRRVVKALLHHRLRSNNMLTGNK
eukprot:1196209-Prorocentrum_minimum.AAC.8